MIAQMKGVQVSKLGRKITHTAFQFQFDEVVDITEFYYPEFSITDFLSSIGGSMGLWLGVGVLQLSGICSTIFSFSKKPLI